MAEYRTDREQEEAMLNAWDDGSLIKKNEAQARRAETMEHGFGKKKNKMQKGTVIEQVAAEQVSAENTPFGATNEKSNRVMDVDYEILNNEPKPERSLADYLREANQEGRRLTDKEFQDGLDVMTSREAIYQNDMVLGSVNAAYERDAADATTDDMHNDHVEDILREHGVKSVDDLPAYVSEGLLSPDERRARADEYEADSERNDDALNVLYGDTYDSFREYSVKQPEHFLEIGPRVGQASFGFVNYTQERLDNESATGLTVVSSQRASEAQFEDPNLLTQDAEIAGSNTARQRGLTVETVSDVAVSLQSGQGVQNTSNSTSKEKPNMVQRLGEKLEDAEPEAKEDDDVGKYFLNGMIRGIGSAAGAQREAREKMEASNKERARDEKAAKESKLLADMQAAREDARDQKLSDALREMAPKSPQMNVNTEPSVSEPISLNPNNHESLASTLDSKTKDALDARIARMGHQLDSPQGTREADFGYNE